ncbi:MAG: hypothetical protein HC923_10345 [Myxococcales bacterium]|nr:hypothetical protein [Myxococcales bacterium]
MPSSSYGWSIPFHAAKHPKEALVPSTRAEGRVEAAHFPDVSATPGGPAPAETIAELERELQARMSAAHREGVQKGHAEAKAQHDRSLQELREQVQGAMATFRAALDRVEIESSREALEVAMGLAEHVLRQRLVSNPEALMSSLEPLAGALEGLEPMVVVCDPATGALLGRRLGELQQRLGVAGIQVEVDESFEAGDCVLQRGPSTLDARISGRLARLKELVAKELGFEGELS